MKRKLLLLPLWLLMAFSARADVSHMHIELLSGGEEQFALAQIGKIMFADNMMNLYDNSGALLGCTPVGQIEKIVFFDKEQAVDNVAVSSIQVFPNPTQESLFIRGIEGTQTVRIFSMQGQLMQSAEAMDGEANLQVGGLQKGTYLLQIGAQVVKFIKD